MKMNNKLTVKLTAIALLSGLIFTFTHCVPQTAKEIGDGGGYSKSTISTPATPPSEGQIINEIQVTTGIKNHEEILHTMGTLTGIDPYANSAVLNKYREVEMSLPTDNDIKVYTTTQQVAVTKLAAEYCDQLTSNGTLRALIWPGLNFGQGANLAFSNRVQFINQTIDAFWGPILTNEELIMARNDLDALMTMLINNETSTGATMRTVNGVCTSVLSSAYVILL